MYHMKLCLDYSELTTDFHGFQYVSTMVNTPLFSMVCMSPVNSQLWQAKPSHDIQIGSAIA